MADQLSEVFDLVEVRGLLTGGFAVRGPWVSGAAIDVHRDRVRPGPADR